MSVQTAQVAVVKIGFYETEGMRTEDGTYYIAIPQIADLVKTSRNTAARDFKRLMGEGFKTSNLKTYFNRAKTTAVTLVDFERLLTKLDRAGNIHAQEIRDSLVGLGLYQIFADAFGQELTPEDRQFCLREWQGVRQRLRDVHGGMQQAALRRGHPASKVHDLMTVLIFGDTAEAARMKQLVDPEADVTIGLNHQEEIAGMNQLIQAKKNYAYMKNLEGTWQEQVQRAVAKR